MSELTPLRLDQADAQNVTLVRCIAENALAWIHDPKMSTMPTAHDDDGEHEMIGQALSSQAQAQARPHDRSVVMQGGPYGTAFGLVSQKQIATTPPSSIAQSNYTDRPQSQLILNTELRHSTPARRNEPVPQPINPVGIRLSDNHSQYMDHREGGVPGLIDAEQAKLQARNKAQAVPDWAEKLLLVGQSNHQQYSLPRDQAQSQQVYHSETNDTDEIKIDDADSEEDILSGLQYPTSEIGNRFAVPLQPRQQQAQADNEAPRAVTSPCPLQTFLTILKRTLGPEGINTSDVASFNISWDHKNFRMSTPSPFSIR